MRAREPSTSARSFGGIPVAGRFIVNMLESSTAPARIEVLATMLRRIARKIPVAIVVVVTAIAVSMSFHLEGHGIASVGTFPHALPGFALPAVAWREPFSPRGAVRTPTRTRTARWSRSSTRSRRTGRTGWPAAAPPTRRRPPSSSAATSPRTRSRGVRPPTTP